MSLQRRQRRTIGRSVELGAGEGADEIRLRVEYLGDALGYGAVPARACEQVGAALAPGGALQVEFVVELLGGGGVAVLQLKRPEPGALHLAQDHTALLNARWSRWLGDRSTDQAETGQ